MKLVLEITPQLLEKLKQMAIEQECSIEELGADLLDLSAFGKPKNGAELIDFMERNDLFTPEFGGTLSATDLARTWRGDFDRQSRDKLSSIDTLNEDAEERTAA